MNMFQFLAVTPVEPTTSAAIFNDGSVVGWTFDTILYMVKDFIILLRSFKFYGNVSYFDFFIALTVMSIVIVYLLNIARSPGVETASHKFKREAKAKRREKSQQIKRDKQKG